MKRGWISRDVLVALVVAGWLLVSGIATACGGQSTEDRGTGAATPTARVITPTPSATATPTPVQDQPSPSPAPVADNTTPSPSPGGSGGPTPDVPQQLLDAARRDLSQRTGVPEAAVRLVQAEQVTWPDASLGHPEPGVLYAQVLTPGWRLVLAANSQRYTYHTDSSQRVVFVG